MFWYLLFTYSKCAWHYEDINQICSGNTIYQSLGLRLYLQIVWKSLTNSICPGSSSAQCRKKEQRLWSQTGLRFNSVQVGQANLVLWVSVSLLGKQDWRCPIKVSFLAIPRSTGPLVTWLSLLPVFALVFPSTLQLEPQWLAHCISLTCQACSLL